MKYLILSIFLVLITTSCDRLVPNNGKVKKPNSTKKEKIYNGKRKNYLDGKLTSIVTYKDSLKNGEAINYYPDGNVNIIFNYKDNKKHGDFKWFYENGKLYEDGSYKNGKKHGLFKRYTKTGKLSSEMTWFDGLPCKGLKEYDDNGQLKATPKIVVKHKNTIKLDNTYTIEFSLNDNRKNVKFYEGYLGDNNSFSSHFIAIDGSGGKGIIEYYVNPGTYIMKTITIIAEVKTKDNNFYIITKDVNIAAENRF